MLELHQLSVTIGSQPLVRDLSLQLKPGQLHVIIGPNGTGKTSLLRTLFCELPLQSGDLRFNQKSRAEMPITQWRQLFGYMPQNTQSDLELSVLEVVVLGRLERLKLRLSDEDLRAALAALADFGITHLADRPMYSLSGG